MECELVTEFSRLEELSIHWKRWVREDDSARVFQRWEWTRAFLRAYGDGISLCCLAIHEAGKPAGILPLMQKGDVIQFLGSPDSDYNDLLCEQGKETAVLAAALEYALRSPIAWESIVLEKIPEHSKIYRTLGSLPVSLKKHLQLVFRCPSPAIVVNQNFAVIDALVRKEQLSRYQRKLEKQGLVTFRHFESREEARAHLDRFFEQHITRWAMAEERSQFLEPEARAFYEALIEEFDPRNDLRFGALELDSRPIAYHFGFQHRGTLTWYKPTFDVNHWDTCPGDVLLRSLLQYVKRFALDELDFTLGGETFKYRFSNQVRRNYILYFERRPRSLAAAALSVVRHVQQRLREKPEAKGALKNCLRRAQRITAAARQLTASDLLLKAFDSALRSVSRCVWFTDEARVWTVTSDTGIDGSKVSLTPATLSDIVSASLESGTWLPAAQLHGYRRLLKQGDRAFIARTTGNETFVVCVGYRREIEVFASGDDRALRFADPVLTVSDWRQIGGAPRHCVPSEVLKAVSARMADEEIWVCVKRTERAWKTAAESGGMPLRYRLIRRVFLRSFRHTRLQSPLVNGAPGALEVKGVIRVSS